MSILTEGKKFSKDLINTAFKDDNFTFGFELEAYVTNINPILKLIEKDVVKNSKKQGSWLIKPLEKVTYNDILSYFVPIDVQPKENYSSLSRRQNEIAVMKDRIEKSIKTEDDEITDTKGVFGELRKKRKMFHIIGLLKIAPKNGFNVSRDQNMRILDLIKSNNAFKLVSLKSLDIRLYEEGEEDLEFNLIDNPGYREKFYEILSNLFQKTLGMSVVHELNDKKIKETSNEYTKWIITTDSSLGNEDGVSSIGFELISPVMKLNDGIRAMKMIFDTMNSPKPFGIPLKFSTDETTGFHVNIGMKNMNDFDYVKMLFLMNDTFIAQKFSREKSDMAELTYTKMVNSAINSNTAIINTAMALMKQDTRTPDVVEQFIQRLKIYVPTSKFQSVNLEKFVKQEEKFVEFRSIGNTDYHKRFKDVFDAIKTYVVVIYIATQPKVYRKEYLQKLIALVQKIIVTALNQQTAQKRQQSVQRQTNQDQSQPFQPSIQRNYA